MALGIFWNIQTINSLPHQVQRLGPKNESREAYAKRGRGHIPRTQEREIRKKAKGNVRIYQDVERAAQDGGLRTHSMGEALQSLRPNTRIGCDRTPSLITMKNKNTKPKKEQHPNPLNLSARFLAARPDLVGPWIIGAHGLLPIFKTEHRGALVAYLETVQREFFAALEHFWMKRNPNQKLAYTFGTICKNAKGEERLVIGITANEKGKPTYDYMDDGGKIGACNESSMTSWMEKR